MATRDWHSQTHRTKEKLQANGYTKTYKDSSFHLIPLVQKVKRRSQKEKESAQLPDQDEDGLRSLVLLCRLELQHTPFVLLALNKLREGGEEKYFI